MGFEPIQKQYKGPGQGVTGAAIGCMKHHKTHFFVLRLGVDLMKTLNVTHGDRLVVSIGTGRHTGQIRMEPNNFSGFCLMRSGRNGKSCYLKLSRLSDTVPHLMAPAPHKFRNGALYIELPEWARAKTGKAA